MKILFYVTIMLICLLAIFYFFNKKNGGNNSEIIIYKITYDDMKSSKVEAIIYKENSLSFYANDSLLMTYSNIPYAGIKVNSKGTIEKIKNFNYDELAIEKYSECKAITKNEYIIKTSDKSNNKKQFIVPEVYGCENGSKYKFIEFLNHFFNTPNSGNH